MGGRAVAKKARRRSCVWVAMAAFFARYVTSFPLTSSRAQPGHGLVELSRKFRAEVTRILAFGHEVSWWEDHRVVLVRGRHQGHGSRVRRRVFDGLGDFGSDIGIQDEIDEFERVLRMRSPFRDRQRVGLL